MNITDHLDLIRAQIEALPSNPTIKYFSGELVVEDLKDIKIDGKRPYVLLSCGGGNIPERNQRTKLEVDALFGAWVIAKVDPATHGMSTIASDVAVQIAQIVEAYRGDVKTNPKMPVLQSIKESFNGQKNNHHFSAWSVIWSQRIVL